MYFKQVDEIVSGAKTQTRRIVKPGEFMMQSKFPGGVYSPVLVNYEVRKWHPVNCPDTSRLKWQVGRDYAVSPGRGKPGVLIAPNGKVIFDPQDEMDYYNRVHGIIADSEQRHLGAAKWLVAFDDCVPLRIVITGLRREPLQAISEADAVAEGWPEDEDARECPHCDALYPTGWYDGPNMPCTCNPVTWYRELWEQINGRGSWDKPTDVWVITFEVKR